jgi:hypothetical protein
VFRLTCEEELECARAEWIGDTWQADGSGASSGQDQDPITVKLKFGGASMECRATGAQTPRMCRTARWTWAAALNALPVDNHGCRSAHERRTGVDARTEWLAIQEVRKHGGRCASQVLQHLPHKEIGFEHLVHLSNQCAGGAFALRNVALAR